MINRVMFSSATDMWSTPQATFDELNRDFGFTLDVCASPENAKCARFFTKEQDGLAQDWGGAICWLNPPYGREIGKWVKKAGESRTLVVGLLPARTDTRWFHDHILGKAEIRFIKGRLKFGGSTNSAPFPSMIVVWNKPAGKDPLVEELSVFITELRESISRMEERCVDLHGQATRRGVVEVLEKILSRHDSKKEKI